MDYAAESGFILLRFEERFDRINRNKLASAAQFDPFQLQTDQKRSLVAVSPPPAKPTIPRSKL
jgi:hypothetical protein